MAVGQFVNTWTSRGDEKQDAQTILDARAMYLNYCIVNLYAEAALPLELRKAQHRNWVRDRADEMYQELTKK